jgi:plastocyanin
MVASNKSTWSRARQKPFSLWVIAGGLVYTSLTFLAMLVPLVITSGITAGGGFVPILLLFVALFLVAGVFSFRAKRWAYLLAAAVSIVLILLYLPLIASTLSNPADSVFWLVISVIPALLLVVIFSLLSFRYAKTGLAQKSYLASPHSAGGLFTVAIIGFVIGSLIVGAVGANVILRNLSSGKADITILPNAMSLAKAYEPLQFHAAAGGTVTWINKDTSVHTVTSNTTGQFDSGNLATGASWSHTFALAGTYYYYCTIHPSMWGVVIVS